MSEKNYPLNEVDHFLKVMAQLEKLGQPIRPSPEELQLYEEYVKAFAKKDPKSQLLILGVTPELRDIALRYGLTPACCDIAPPMMFEAAKRYMKESGEEELITSDWLDLPENVQYDIVLGDCSLNMLKPDSLEPFLQKMARITKDDGLNIQRIQICSEKHSVEYFVQAMEDYRKNYHSIPIWRYLVFLAVSMNSYYYPEYAQSIDFWQKVLMPHLTNQERADLSWFIQPMDRGIFSPKKEKLMELLNKYFVIDRIEPSKGVIYWDITDTYVLRRN